jgi:hypothetical protein
MGKTLTTEEFIQRARKVHGDKYDYSKVEYKDAETHICIICPKHGEFIQTPHSHIRGQKCPKCAIENKAHTTDWFIEKAKLIHGDKYDYTKVKYVNNREKVEIVCKKHGAFFQRPETHLAGSICPICSNESRQNSLEYYIQLSKEKHGDKYDFSESVYLGATKEIEVICKECGNVFFISPISLVKSKGCKMCNIENERKIYCLEGELWRDVTGFSGYQVSNKGRVRSIDRIISVGKHKRKVDGMIMKLSDDKDGYKMVSFKIGESNKTYRKRVHRLVAEAFIENPNNYDCIDHINGVRDDNRVENLRWCTVKMNSNYELALANKSEAIRNSYIKNPYLRQVRAETWGKSGRIKVEVFKDGISLGVFDSQTDAAEFLGIRQAQVSAYMNGRTVNRDGITIKKR